MPPGQGYDRTRQEIVAEAATAYYQAQSAQRMVEVMQQQITTLNEAVRVASGLHDQGMVAKLDVLRPTSELASAQTALTQAENGCQQALANLKRLLDLPRDTAITVAPATETTATPQVELTVATQTALAHRPEMKQLQANIRATDAQRTIALAGRRPDLSLHVQYDFERPTTFPQIGNWWVALTVRQPLYDGGTAHAKVAEVKSQRQELVRPRRGTFTGHYHAGDRRRAEYASGRCESAIGHPGKPHRGRGLSRRGDELSKPGSADHRRIERAGRTHQ